MNATITQTIELRRQLQADILKLIGDFENATKMQIRCINLNHVSMWTVSGKSPRRFVADLNIEVSL